MTPLVNVVAWINYPITVLSDRTPPHLKLNVGWHSATGEAGEHQIEIPFTIYQPSEYHIEIREQLSKHLQQSLKLNVNQSSVVVL